MKVITQLYLAYNSLLIQKMAGIGILKYALFFLWNSITILLTDSSHRTLILYLYAQTVCSTENETSSTKTTLGHPQNINGVNSVWSKVMKNVWEFKSKI